MNNFLSPVGVALLALIAILLIIHLCNQRAAERRIDRLERCVSDWVAFMRQPSVPMPTQVLPTAPIVDSGEEERKRIETERQQAGGETNPPRLVLRDPDPLVQDLEIVPYVTE